MSKNQVPSMDSYRFGRGEDPSDEMMAQIMREAREDAVRRQQKATKEYFDALKSERPTLSPDLESRINRLSND